MKGLVGAEVNEPASQVDTLGLFALFEGVATIGSGLAVWDPEGFGIAGLTTGTGITIVSISRDKKIHATAALAGAEFGALCIYDMAGPPKYGNLSNATVFGRNMLGWQIIGLTILAGAHFKRGAKNDSASNVEMMLTMNAGTPGIALDWHFQ